jgi:hypothetical protein
MEEEVNQAVVEEVIENTIETESENEEDTLDNYFTKPEDKKEDSEGEGEEVDLDAPWHESKMKKNLRPSPQAMINAKDEKYFNLAKKTYTREYTDNRNMLTFYQQQVEAAKANGTLDYAKGKELDAKCLHYAKKCHAIGSEWQKIKAEYENAQTPVFETEEEYDSFKKSFDVNQKIASKFYKDIEKVNGDLSDMTKTVADIAKKDKLAPAVIYALKKTKKWDVMVKENPKTQENWYNGMRDQVINHYASKKAKRTSSQVVNIELPKSNKPSKKGESIDDIRRRKLGL